MLDVGGFKLLNTRDARNTRKDVRGGNGPAVISFRLSWLWRMYENCTVVFPCHVIMIRIPRIHIKKNGSGPNQVLNFEYFFLKRFEISSFSLGKASLLIVKNMLHSVRFFFKSATLKRLLILNTFWRINLIFTWFCYAKFIS